ncbi:aminotransferase class IV [Synechococcus elongatus IITB7]|uniref:aminotransferase class IV n=1 Tax=Synechococcus elongatus TaxID=32046 RepID=UPI0030CD967D
MIGYCNGEWIPIKDLTIAVSDRGFSLGDGLFETLLVWQGRVCLAKQHWRRLTSSAQQLRIPLPPEASLDLLQATVDRNQLETGALRMTLTRGCGQRGLQSPDPLQPLLVIVPSLSQPQFQPLRLVTAQTVRRCPESILSRFKTLSYLENVLARQEAEQQQADEALLLTPSDRLSEAAAANVFVRLNDDWWTPPLSDGALPGIVRQRLLATGWAQEASIAWSQRDQIDAIALSNSLSFRPVSHWDGRALKTDLEDWRSRFEHLQR